jgi:V/A-type H+-transporting ATPase subunit D
MSTLVDRMVEPMVELRRVPPGRAGRLWLTSRLQAAQRASDLLDRKVRVLRQERERFGLLEDQTRARWRASWRTADVWALRAAMVAGSRDLRLSTPAGRARVEVTWATVMGVRYPAEVSCELPRLEGSDRSPSSAALVEAAAAGRDAIEAAAAHGAAAAACRAIDAEMDDTRRRSRAINDRWIPRLAEALSRVTRSLDETEREETVRRLRAAPQRVLRGAAP